VAQVDEERALSLENLYTLPWIIGTAPSQPVWSPGGRRVAFLWNDEGRNFMDVWTWSLSDPEAAPVRVTRMGGPAGPSASDAVSEEAPTASEAAFAAARVREREERDPGVGSVAWHPRGGELLFTLEGDLWTVVPGAEPRRLMETPERESAPAYAPDGRHIAFLRDGDVWVLESGASVAGETGGRREVPRERRLTRLTEDAVGVTSYEWSPDGGRLAVLVSEDTPVTTRGIPDYLAEETELRRVRRAYPGEPTARPRLAVARVGDPGDGRASPDLEWVSLPGEAGEPWSPDLILDFRWSPGGERIAVDTGEWTAKDRRIFMVEVADGASRARLAYREADPGNETFYFWRIAWAADGESVYLLSDRREDYHVWALDVDMALGGDLDGGAGAEALRQLTSGAWAVASMHPVKGGLVVVGNRDAGEERHLFRVDHGPGPGAPAPPRRITRRPGTHTPFVSPDGRHAAVLYSSDDTPPDLWVTPLDPGEASPVGPGGEAPGETSGQLLWRITDSPLPEFDEYRWVTPEYVTFASHVDGTTLHGRLTLPPDFDPERRYPAILGSVYTDVVRNQWGGRTAHPTWGLDQLLAQEGYILLTVDVRGSWGRGREHRRGIRLDYGGMDIEDLESGVRFLETLGYVDMDRVGIWGSSYGGLMTAMSLFRKPGLYAAGIAGAPATNVWHALSGQMAVMLAPEDSPEEYADSSPFMHADGLEDPLMIIHGMQDRVVLFKDTMALVQRLILLGKDVDLVALPASGHGWDLEGLAQTRFAFQKMLDFFELHLKGDGP
jgi:dipeptidyl-peptidase-4